MQNNGLSVLLLAVLVVGVVVLLQWVWRRPVPKESVADTISDPGESEVAARPLMTPEEATLFNLIRLAAQDYLLVLVKLPILQVVSVVDKDEEARKALMRSIQSVRLDVVLVHPGTLRTETVVHFRKEGQDRKQSEERDQLIDTVLKAGGIKVVVFQLNQSYSVEQVVAMLGLADEE